jgi:hypothetical protein
MRGATRQSGGRWPRRSEHPPFGPADGHHHINATARYARVAINTSERAIFASLDVAAQRSQRPVPAGQPLAADCRNGP